jgi:DNA-binding transcriptional regulator LsrR (DeoR family)
MAGVRLASARLVAVATAGQTASYTTTRDTTNMRARLGMLVVETIAKIRRAYFVQQKSIKAICRELGLSRKVVRKVLGSEATEFRLHARDAALAEDRPVA